MPMSVKEFLAHCADDPSNFPAASKKVEVRSESAVSLVRVSKETNTSSAIQVATASLDKASKDTSSMIVDQGPPDEHVKAAWGHDALDKQHQDKLTKVARQLTKVEDMNSRKSSFDEADDDKCQTLVPGHPAPHDSLQTTTEPFDSVSGESRPKAATLWDLLKAHPNFLEAEAALRSTAEGKHGAAPQEHPRRRPYYSAWDFAPRNLGPTQDMLEQDSPRLGALNLHSAADILHAINNARAARIPTQVQKTGHRASIRASRMEFECEEAACDHLKSAVGLRRSSRMSAVATDLGLISGSHGAKNQDRLRPSSRLSASKDFGLVGGSVKAPTQPLSPLSLCKRFSWMKHSSSTPCLPTNELHAGSWSAPLHSRHAFVPGRLRDVFRR
jgi:hypothetical protein